MAPSAVNGEEKATIGAEEINKPPSGVVLPPKDIRGENERGMSTLQSRTLI